MTWSYDATSTTALNKVRRRIGDTNTNDQLLANEEIEDFLSEYSNDLYATAGASCEAICAKLARESSHSTNGMSNSRDQKFDHYERLAERMWGKARLTATGFAGGVSEAEEDSFDDDTDLKPYSFRIAQDDKAPGNGGIGSSNER
jgi:hypothetical protein